MSASANSEPRILICDHCHSEIERDPQKFIFVVSKPLDPLAPFTCRIQRADFLIGDEEMAFGTIVCLKYWLLRWPERALKAIRKATTALHADGGRA